MTRPLSLILCAAAVALPTIIRAEPKRLPNIILILADDMGYDSVSALNDELGDLKTPHIDKLVEQGMHFTDGHSASAVCTPTRYGLLTGRYCWRTPLKNEVIWTYGQPLLRNEELTMPELLKDAGYRTGMIGKWHLGLGWMTKDGKGANADIDYRDKTWGSGHDKIAAAEANIDWSKEFEGGPLDHGFDDYFGVDLPNMAPYTWLENRKVTAVPTIPKPKGMFGAEGLMVEGWQLEEVLPGLRDKACVWITESARKDEPFFLYMSLTSPHTPIAPSKEFQGKSGFGKYADFLIETDDVVGRMLDVLEKTGEADNTLVIFTADNGTANKAGFTGLEKRDVNLRHHFRGIKSSIYEGGHRVPLVLRWPGVIEPGSRNDEVVCLNDFFATFAELTGHKLKDSEGVDSTSILPLITGKAKTLPDRAHVISHSYGGQFSIRDGDWKLVLPMKEGGEFELYHLGRDLKETENLASQHPERVEKMTATFRACVENGRSTPGEPQPNHDGETRWHGLPW